MTTRFPFVAIVGLALAKRSLIYHTLDPRLGGILLQGHRGCAKSTLARAFTDLLQTSSKDTAPFVEVPLGTTEDRLLGAVNAGNLVEQGQWQLQQGLMAQADGGVLYIDEVNLLPDHLTDSLLDAAVSGKQQVERDGLSANLKTRFILVGSMNPEEGELRPQLQDRFAHKLLIQDNFEVPERMEIVRRRMEFEDDPEKFAETWQAETQEILQKLAAARNLLPLVVIPEMLRIQIAERAKELKLEGLRTELAVLRTARCAAAWQGSQTLTEDHVQEAWELCLGQSVSKTDPPSPPTEQQSPNQQIPPRPKWQTSRQPQGTRPDPISLRTELETKKEDIVWPASQSMLEPPPPLRNSEQQGRTLDWLATLRKSWRGLNTSPVWQLQYAHTQRRRFWWLLVDASRSTGSTDFLALVRNQLIQLTQQYRADRFHLMVLQSGESLCLGRKMSAIETEKRLRELQEAVGGSALFKLLRQSQVALRRNRVGPKDRLIFASDGLFEVTGSSVTKEQSKLRHHWQQLLCAGIASQWWHPVSVAGLENWVEELSKGLRLRTIRLEVE
ncbi:MAG: AAA family ATPase [bacterium]